MKNYLLNKINYVWNKYLVKSNGIYLDMPKGLVPKTNVNIIFIPNLYLVFAFLGVFGILVGFTNIFSSEDAKNEIKTVGQNIGESVVDAIPENTAKHFDYFMFDKSDSLKKVFEEKIYNEFLMVSLIKNEGRFSNNPNDGACNVEYNKKFPKYCAGVCGVTPIVAKESGLFTDEEMDEHFNMGVSIPEYKIHKILNGIFYVDELKALNSKKLVVLIIDAFYNGGKGRLNDNGFAGVIPALHNKYNIELPKGKKLDNGTIYYDSFNPKLVEKLNEETKNNENGTLMIVSEILKKSKKDNTNKIFAEGLDKRYEINMNLISDLEKNYVVCIKIKEGVYLGTLAGIYGGTAEKIAYLNDIKDKDKVPLNKEVLIFNSKKLSEDFDKYGDLLLKAKK